MFLRRPFLCGANEVHLFVLVNGEFEEGVRNSLWADTGCTSRQKTAVKNNFQTSSSMRILLKLELLTRNFKVKFQADHMGLRGNED